MNDLMNWLNRRRIQPLLFWECRMMKKVRRIETVLLPLPLASNKVMENGKNIF
jgi:hypothetical protein